MSRVVAITGNYQVVPHIIMSLVSQNYAGQESCGIAITGKDGFGLETGSGVAMSVFAKFDPKEFAGKTGIGKVADKMSKTQPEILENRIAFCADASIHTSEVIGELLLSSRKINQSVQKILLEVAEPFAFVLALPDGRIIAARNNGRMPLCFGKIDNENKGFWVSSQNGVFGLEAEFIHEVFPGEMLIVDRCGYQRIAVNPHPDIHRCIQEPMFLQKPGNYCGGMETSQARQAIGRKLGRKFAQRTKVKGDSVAVSIPDGGTSYLLGFAETSGVRIDPGGALKPRYPQSPIMSKNLGYTLIPEVVCGKSVCVVDDAFKSGSRLRHMAKTAREMGATEVHAAIATQLVRTCPHAKDVVIDFPLPDRNDLGVDTLTSLTSTEIINAINTTHRIYCTDCLR